MKTLHAFHGRRHILMVLDCHLVTIRVTTTTVARLVLACISPGTLPFKRCFTAAHM